MDRQGCGESFERLQRGISGADLYAGDIAAVQIGVLGKTFLGPTFRVPQGPNLPAQRGGGCLLSAAAWHLAIFGTTLIFVSRLIVTIDLS